eukprot:GHVT01039486.1.p2 GENE.GHVT01039486.1~~GHVT01039486.1.p2  ORF type:complete len:284 (-),score=26.88 GHVT01039486.1:21-872(-)
MHGSDMLVQWVWLESDIQVRPEEIFLCLFDHPSNRFRAALHWGRPLPNTGSYSWQVDSTFEENDVCQCVYLALFIRNPFDQSEASRRSTAGAALQRRDRPDDQLTRALVVEKTARKERRATILSASEEESASDSSGDEDGDYKDDKHEGNAERRHLLRSQRRAPSQSRRCSARRKDAIPLFDRAVCHSHAFFIIRPTALAELELMYAAFCRAHQLEMEVSLKQNSTRQRNKFWQAQLFETFHIEFLQCGFRTVETYNQRVKNKLGLANIKNLVFFVFTLRGTL